MKVNSIIAGCAVVLAICASGCRYNKANEGAEGAGDGVSTLPGYTEGVSDVGTAEVEAQDVDSLASADSGSDINQLMASAAAFEDIYQRVTDVAFAPVYFTLDSTTIGPAELGKVDAVAQHLAAMPTRVVVVEGHCDERGSNEYNMSLGESRAATVRDYLMRSGVAPERIQTRSYGEERPAVDGHDEGAWSRNRRGEFVLFQM